MAVNRYYGNSGRMERVPEKGERPFERPKDSRPTVSARPPRLQKDDSRGGLGSLSASEGALQSKLSEVFKKFSELESEDIILLLILYLLYRESRDEQYLIILGLMLLL